MFQPTTESVDSLTIDDITGQTVPESGTGRTECSVADGCGWIINLIDKLYPLARH